MTNEARLITVKVIHTFVWLCFNAVIFYMLYEVVSGRISILLWIGYGIIFLEMLTLIAFRNYCPLTVVARKYSDSDKHNFDIYLPEWLAKHNKLIYTGIMGIIVILTVYRFLK